MANNYDVGDLARITAEFTDAGGADVDPTDVFCAYTDPSGNVTTLHYGVDAALVRSAAGHYYVDINVDEAGTWLYHWYSTGTGQASEYDYFTATATAAGLPAGRACTEYLTVDDVQLEFGDDVTDLTDAQIQTRIDRLVAQLEGMLGHTFGRAIIARSTATQTVQVTATAVIIGGDTYLFAAYATLGALVTAVNGAGESYRMELLPQVDGSTPSTLLAVMAATTCGPNANNRAVLCISALWLRLSGDGQSHLFLPYPLGSVTTVEENAAVLANTYYWATPGESWIVRKYCDCLSGSCQHPRGHWSRRYPGNIEVTYVPQWWIGGPPASLQAALLEAFGSQAGVGSAGMESESFGEYSYRRARAPVHSAQDILGNAARMYQRRYHP